MNKNTIFNVVISIAVIILFAMQFSSDQDEVENLSSVDSTQISKKKGQLLMEESLDSVDLSGKIAAVNLDTLMNKYKKHKKNVEGLEKEQSRFISLQNRYQGELIKKQKDIEQKAKNNIYLSETQYQLDLQEYQKKAMEYQEKLAAEEKRIYDKGTKYQAVLIEELQDFVNEYSVKNNIDYVVYTGTGSSMLYAKKSLDITDAVVEGLNEAYKEN